MNHITWLDRSEYPFLSKYFPINGQKMHYIDEGQGEILLFVHGTPSWSFDYRHLIKDLRKSFRCLAVDHIGFGLSSKPEVYDYSTMNHSRTLERFILDQQLQNITLVVHDFGGPIGLNFALHHPDRITRLVILNSWLWSSKNDPDFIKLKKILKSPFLPFLYRYLNFSPKFILPNSFGDYKLSGRILKQFTRPFGDPSERMGAIAFAQSLLNDQDWFQELWTKKSVIAAKPSLFVWGLKDRFIKPHYLDKFLDGFSNTASLRLECCGHFPQEEEPDKVIEVIRNFMFKYN